MINIEITVTVAQNENDETVATIVRDRTYREEVYGILTCKKKDLPKIIEGAQKASAYLTDIFDEYEDVAVFALMSAVLGLEFNYLPIVNPTPILI